MNNGLGIGELTHGVSTNGAYEYLDGINTQALEHTIEAVQDTAAVKAALQRGWQGNSEAAYERNLDSAVMEVTQAIDMIKKGIESEISDLVETMADQDKQMLDSVTDFSI